MKKFPPASDATPEALVRAVARHGPNARAPSSGPASRSPHRDTCPEESHRSGRIHASASGSDCYVEAEPRRTVEFPPLPEGTDPVVREEIKTGRRFLARWREQKERHERRPR